MTSNATERAVPVVGDTLTETWQYELLPVGTVVELDGAPLDQIQRVKDEDGQWRRLVGTPQPRESYRMRDRRRVVSLPNEPSLPAIGSTISTEAEYAALPVGAVVEMHTHIQRSRHADGLWRRVGDGAGSRGITDHAMSQEHPRTLVSLPIVLNIQPEPPALSVGDAIDSAEKRDALPVGTVLTAPSHGGSEYTVTEVDGEKRLSTSTWIQGHSLTSTRTDSFLTIVSLPDALRESVSEVEAALAPEGVPESYDQYVQRFRTTVYGQAQSSGVSLTPLNRAMEKMSIPEPVPLRVGMALDWRDSNFKATLPVGTVLSYRAGDALYLWGVHYLGAATVLVGRGQYIESAYPLRIERLPNSTSEPWVLGGTAEDRARIEEFQRQAWEYGNQLKGENSWCGDFEHAMERMGINGQTVTSTPGTVLTAEQMAALPVGSILRWVQGGSNALFIRDDTEINPCRTRNLAGTNRGSWSNTGVQLVHTPGQPMAIPVLSHEEMDTMPIGTGIRDYGAGEPQWTKTEEGWQSRTYSTASRTDAFLLTHLHYVTIPGIN